MHRTTVLDATEKIVLVAMLGALAYRLVPHLADKPVNVIFLISETIVVAMIACRTATKQISLRPFDWLVGFGGTFLPLIARDSAASGFSLGGVLMLIGFAVSVGAQLSLRRSLGVVAANRGVKTSGLYAFVRHPMYLGYFCTQMGFLLVNPTGWNATIFAVCMGCHVCRIHVEERLLSSDHIYQAFKQRVQYRLVPHVY